MMVLLGILYAVLMTALAIVTGRLFKVIGERDQAVAHIDSLVDGLVKAEKKELYMYDKYLTLDLKRASVVGHLKEVVLLWYADGFYASEDNIKEIIKMLEDAPGSAS